jgi:uncharacterized membrane protein YdjX (TVP38/TMEM64 family)
MCQWTQCRRRLHTGAAEHSSALIEPTGAFRHTRRCKARAYTAPHLPFGTKTRRGFFDGTSKLYLDGTMTESGIRYLRIVSWLALASVLLYVYFFRRNVVQGELEQAVTTSVALGYLVYFALGCIRGFTLIPSTNLVLLGTPLFPPCSVVSPDSRGNPYLFVQHLLLFRISSSRRIFETRHKRQLERVKTILRRNQMPIVIGWSFFPLAPTDWICYASGILKIDFLKFALGVLIAEGTIWGIYIFLGDGILRFLHLR